MPILHQVLVSHLIGGAGIVAIRLAAAARARGLACRTWLPGPGPASRALEGERVEWHRYDLDGLRGSTLSQLSSCARMLPALAGRERPIVHVHNPVVYGYLVPVLRAVRARTVVHFQIEPVSEEIKWSMKYPPDHIVTCARYIADLVRQELGPGCRSTITAVPNSVDLERFTPGSQAEARQRLGLQTNRFVVLMMANLAPHKGQETALRALAVLASRNVDTECWLAGEDRTTGAGYERTLRTLAAETGLNDRVKFLGFRPDGPELLKAADVLLLPSTHEGLPLTVLEAQAAEVPVIGSTIPGIAEVIKDQETGLLVDASDYLGYAAAVERLYADSALRLTIAAAASNQVRGEYRWELLEHRMFQIYAALNPSLGRTAPETEGTRSA